MNGSLLTLGLSLLGGTFCFASAAPTGFDQPDPVRLPQLYRWTDTCNTYVIKQGDSAVLIDLGDGSVIENLGRIGVRQVDWVVFTHHHREQCQGAQKLVRSTVKIAGPEAERPFFEHPTDFRKMQVSLGDPFTVYGASYVRPPIASVKLDRGLSTNDVLTWRDCEFQCVPTPGNSPGALSYRIKLGGCPVIFSGDVMLADSKMHTWFDSEWDYGFAAGIRTLKGSVSRLREFKDTDLLLPSHGASIDRPQEQLNSYSRKLDLLESLYVRGYGVEGASVAYQDKVSRPTAVSNVWEVVPGLYKFKRPNFWPNFNLILAPNGHALLVDCGLLDEKFLDAALDGMRRHYGLKAIDAIIVTHMHGDHFLEAPHIHRTWGAPIWALDNMVDKMQHPEWFDYAAPIQAYGKKNPDGTAMNGVTVQRRLKPGEKILWQGMRFTIDWMPGQTEFALCMHGKIGGKLVAFTGDNIFGDPDDPSQTGHEAMVAHNSAILEEGYIYAGEFLKRLSPDILVGGHSFVMGNPKEFIKRYRQWSYEMRAAFQSLCPEKDYRYWFDPFWVHAEPYRTSIVHGQSVTVDIHVRNFKESRQRHRIEFHAPPGIGISPRVIEGSLKGHARSKLSVRVTASPALAPGIHLVGLDITTDGQRRGEWFDFVISTPMQ